MVQEVVEKTYTYNAIIKFCEEYKIKYNCYAYTGIAASPLKKLKNITSWIWITN